MKLINKWIERHQSDRHFNHIGAKSMNSIEEFREEIDRIRQTYLEGLALVEQSYIDFATTPTLTDEERTKLTFATSFNMNLVFKDAEAGRQRNEAKEKFRRGLETINRGTDQLQTLFRGSDEAKQDGEDSDL